MSDELAAIRERDRRAGLQAITQQLALAMAEEGFAVPAKSRDEQWDAPYDEAYRIVLKLGLVEMDEARASAEARVAALREGVAELTEDRTATDPDDEWHRGFHEAVRRLRDIVMMADTGAAAEAHDAAIRREAVEPYMRALTAIAEQIARNALAEPSDA